MKTQCYSLPNSLLRLALVALALLTLFARASFAQNPDLLVGGGNDSIIRCDGNTGALLNVFVTPGSGGLQTLQSFTYGPDGNLYVCSWSTGSVKRYDGQTGAYRDDFVPSGRGGLSNPDQVAFGPDGSLYVSDRFSARILRYDGTTGAFKDVFVSDGRLGGFIAFAFGPDANLYASMFNPSDINQSILRYDGTTGAFKDVFFQAPDGSSAWSGLTFGSDGSLYASRYHTGEVWHFNLNTGAFLGRMSCPFPRADKLTFGPDGYLYVITWDDSHGSIGSVVRFNVQTGQSLGTFVSVGAPGLGGLAFMAKPTTAAVSGTITLDHCQNSAQTLTFTFRPTDGSDNIIKTVTLAADGSFHLTRILRMSYTLHVKGSKWLAKNVSVDDSNGDVTGLSATLLPGDVNGNNRVNLADLGDLSDAFGTTPASPDWNENADLNCDGKVNILDLALLASSFGKKGDL
jgi:sugar lactone lactonase YvrE